MHYSSTVLRRGYKCDECRERRGNQFLAKEKDKRERSKLQSRRAFSLSTSTDPPPELTAPDEPPLCPSR